MHFPAIKTLDLANGVEAVAALRIHSLLHGDLLLNSFYGPAEQGKYPRAAGIDPLQLHHAREALLAALSGWTDTILEIRLAVMPDLALRTRSLIHLHLLIRCRAQNADLALEKVAERCLNLMPLLSAHAPEAECRPVTTEAELDRMLSWLESSHALSVQRRRERLSLAAPLSPAPIGFGSGGRPQEPTAEDGSVVEHLFPWVPELDDWGRLLDTLTCQIDPFLIVLRLLPLESATTDIELLQEALHRFEPYASKNSDTGVPLAAHLRAQYVSRMVALRGPCYQVGVYLLSEHPIPKAFAQVLGAAITHLPQGNDPAHFFKGGYDLKEIPAANALRADYFSDGAAFSLAEAASAFRLPSPPCRDVPGLKVKRFRTAQAQLSEQDAKGPEACRLFVNEHLGMSQPICLDVEDRMRHVFIMGQTGTGKSTLMETMILQDIRGGRGVAVIDPHGDMIDHILHGIPGDRADDVILFDFLDRERPLAFNLIEWASIMERDLIIDELYRVLDHIYDMKQTGGPIFESHFRNMLRLLMGTKPGQAFTGTVLDILKAYANEKFRHWLLAQSEDPQARDFLREAENCTGDVHWRNVSPYITSKFARFVNDTTLRRIVGQEHSSFDIDSIMNSGKIFLVKLGKGRFGSQVAALLVNMMVLRFKLAAMKRGDLPMHQRRDFFLYVDEAHNLPQENLTEMLSEARKFRLGLVLSTQYCSQLGSLLARQGNDLLSSVFGNVGTQIFFRTGAQDAQQLETGLAPYFSALDIMALPNFHGYARMNLGREITPPFSFRTELDPTSGDEALGASIREQSRERYGTPAEEVEEEILEHENTWLLPADTNGDKEGQTGKAEAGDQKVEEYQIPAGCYPSVVNLAVLDLTLASLGMTKQNLRSLESVGIETVRDLLAWSLEELHEIESWNYTRESRLVDWLKEIGCCMRQSRSLFA